MTNDIFVDKLEATYGPYKPGMKNAILAETRAVQKSAFVDLYNAITSTYEKHSPPPLPYINKIASELSISTKPQGQEYVSVCGDCKQDFPIGAYDCPHCGKGDVPDTKNKQSGKPNRKRTVRRRA